MAFIVKKASNDTVKVTVEMPKVIGKKENGKNKYSDSETEPKDFWLPSNFAELLEKQETVQTVFKPNVFTHEGKQYELVWE